MGDSPPYVAVINLAVMAAQHWRTVRLKLIQSGVGNPMGLPGMHVLLDLTESMIIESMVSDKPEDDQRQREQFMADLYRPTLTTAEVEGKPAGWRPPPFDPDSLDDDNEAAFDAIAHQAS